MTFFFRAMQFGNRNVALCVKGYEPMFLEIRGSYIFYRYGGPATFDHTFNGSAQTDTGGTEFAPYWVILKLTN
jgi:hypothetical protein